MIRAAIKISLFATVSLVFYILLLPKFILPKRLAARWKFFLVRTGSRLCASILGMKIKVTGQPPAPPFILVSNHLSYIDILLLMTRVKAVFVSKKEVKRWPAFGQIADILDTIYIDREKLRDSLRVNDLIARTYQAGSGIVFFPEGTSTRGEEVLAFKPVLLAPAANNAYPVHTVSIRYKTPQGTVPAHLSVCWWGDMELWPHLKELLKIPSFEANLTFGKYPVMNKDPRSLAKEVRQAVIKDFEPTTTKDQADLSHAAG